MGRLSVAGGGCRSRRQAADLAEVVGEYAVAALDSGAGQPVEAGAVPAGSAFEVGDAAFAAGAPFDQGAEGSSVFHGATGRAGARSDGTRCR
jgi:hypothetical protein